MGSFSSNKKLILDSRLLLQKNVSQIKNWCPREIRTGSLQVGRPCIFIIIFIYMIISWGFCLRFIFVYKRRLYVYLGIISKYVIFMWFFISPLYLISFHLYMVNFQLKITFFFNICVLNFAKLLSFRMRQIWTQNMVHFF